jgi:hypothetical protein
MRDTQTPKARTWPGQGYIEGDAGNVSRSRCHPEVAAKRPSKDAGAKSANADLDN